MTVKPLNYYLNVHQELIDGCQEHNAEAQKKVYRLYYKAMYNTSLRILKDEHLAEDVMQDAFLKAFQKIHLYNNQSSFGVWLKRIVINESINTLKKTNKEFFTDQDYSHELVEEDPQDFEWSSHQIKQIKFCLMNLSDRYRTILSLILLEGYDLEEASEIMNVSYGNARVLFMRAKNKLKQLVKTHHEKI